MTADVSLINRFIRKNPFFYIGDTKKADTSCDNTEAISVKRGLGKSRGSASFPIDYCRIIAYPRIFVNMRFSTF